MCCFSYNWPSFNQRRLRSWKRCITQKFPFPALRGYLGAFIIKIAEILLIFVKNTHQKAANLTFCLILPVAMIPAWFLGGQYIRRTQTHYWTTTSPLEAYRNSSITYCLNLPLFPPFTCMGAYSYYFWSWTLPYHFSFNWKNFGTLWRTFDRI